MVLALVDDLMFSSKIRSAASQLGLVVVFARSREAALAEMRKERPALIVLDLNATRIGPLDAIADIAADPALAGVPSVGFVSHVQTDLIDAARKAGVTDVLPRSAFAMNLAEILSRGR